MSVNPATESTAIPFEGGNGKNEASGDKRGVLARGPVFRSIDDAKQQANMPTNRRARHLSRRCRKPPVDCAASPSTPMHSNSPRWQRRSDLKPSGSRWSMVPPISHRFESLCMAIEAGGGVPTVRIPDGQRHHVLRALEVGAQIVVVPMINTAEQAKSIVEFGKFPPLGSRGYNVRSRGVEYGLRGAQQGFVRANQRTHLFAQIETAESVSNLDAICQVEGISGIFIGPGDLSVSLGCPADLDGQTLIDVVCDCIRRARAFGLHAGILVPPGRMLSARGGSGGDLLFYGGDVTELSKSWPKLLAEIESKVAQR